MEHPGAKLKPFWTKALPMLRRAYNGHCAYYGLYVHAATGSSTTDHFVPKSSHPDHAYEWGNCRYACGRANGQKGVQSLVDPFNVVDGTFVLHPELMEVSADIPDALRAIEVLGLNEPPCVDQRLEYWEEYRRGELTVDGLIKYAPFVALEMSRQGQLSLDDQGRWPPAAIRARLDESWV